MILYHPDVTKAAIRCQLIYDSSTGIGHLFAGDSLELLPGTKVQCTTVEEFTILKHLGFKVALNQHPSDATLNGVPVPENQGPAPVNPEETIVSFGVPSMGME